MGVPLNTAAAAPSASANMAPVAAAGQGILGGLIGWAQNRWVNKQNVKNANRAWARDVEMWNMQNRYNEPAMQMERLTAAGLNKNLMYGQGNTGNASGSLPKYSAPKVSMDFENPVQPLAIMGAYQDYRLKQAQIDQTKEMTNAVRERGSKDALWNEWFGETKDTRTKEIEARIERILAGTGYTKEQTYALGQDVTRKNQLHGYNLQAMKLRNKKFGEEIEKIVADTRNVNARTRTIPEAHAMKMALGGKDLMIKGINAETLGTKNWQEIAKKQAEIDRINLDVEWYTTKMFGKLGKDAVDAVTKMLPTKMLKTTRDVGGTKRETTWKGFGND